MVVGGGVPPAVVGGGVSGVVAGGVPPAVVGGGVSGVVAGGVPPLGVAGAGPLAGAGVPPPLALSPPLGLSLLPPPPQEMSITVRSKALMRAKKRFMDESTFLSVSLS